MRDDEEPGAEFEELVGSYKARGRSHETACAVAKELTAIDPLQAHLRDELGLSEEQAARPILAAITSAITISEAAAVPVVCAAIAPLPSLIVSVIAISLAALALLGALGAKGWATSAADTAANGMPIKGIAAIAE